MALIDTIEIYLSAGKGGDGVVRWKREKFRPKSGPGGGNGGRGGNVVFKAVQDITALDRLQHGGVYKADDGEAGGNKSQDGKNGDDLVLELPVGSLIRAHEGNKEIELLNVGDQYTFFRGGEGGLGNEHFKSSTNQTPLQATLGKQGEASLVTIDLKLIADIGLIGLPNAGKSSLLNALTNANSKVGAYPFTTLSPSLGVLFGYTLADIPGLIEGANTGKGLGDKFLRHIERTKFLVHCISSERETPYSDYTTIRKELSHIDGLLDKDEIILFTKSDLLSEGELLEKSKEFVEKGMKVLTCSILDDDSIKRVSDSLVALIAQ